MPTGTGGKKKAGAKKAPRKRTADVRLGGAVFREMSVDALVRAKNERNENEMTEGGLASLEGSVDRWGLVQAIVYNRRTKRIVGGHHTIDAAKARGAEKLPVSVVDLPAEEEDALRLALNKIRGNPNTARLAETLRGFEADLALVAGFSEEELEALLVPDGGPRDGSGSGAGVDGEPPAEAVRFAFGEYAGFVEADVYGLFSGKYEEAKAESGEAVLSDVLRAVFGK